MGTTGSSPQLSVAVGRAIDGFDTLLGIVFTGERYVDTHRLLMLRILSGFADNYLNNLAILAKVVVAAQSVKQAILAYRGRQAGDVDEILLDDSQSGEVLATKRIGFGLLCLLLPYLRILLGFLRDLLLVSGHPVPRQRCSGREGARDPLFG
jgi:hypothetical protein